MQELLRALAALVDENTVDPDTEESRSEAADDETQAGTWTP
jgi:hypothetical protein